MNEVNSVNFGAKVTVNDYSSFFVIIGTENIRRVSIKLKQKEEEKNKEQ